MAERQAPPVRLEPFLAPWLESVVHIESRAYDHPWKREGFLEALQSGYQIQMLLADEVLVGYFVAMQGVGEAHLLNITVAPEHQGHGHARTLMAALHRWAESVAAQRVWLEVRVGNDRAIRLYESLGYQRVNVRRDYYPGLGTSREDALVMFRPLTAQEAA